MKTVRIGGVPEHFNLAWYLTLKNGDYKKKGINLRWKDYHSGTGALCKALRDNTIDMAVILTEGITKDIIEGNPSKIVQTYVETPLIWGIHVAHNSTYQTINDLKNTQAAISRYGSGSHLMAYINAQNNDWNPNEDLQFRVVKNVEGAVEALTNQKADYFMWEKFMTKPLVDQGVFRRVGNCPTPWPCFVIAVSDSFIANHLDTLETILQTINTATQSFKDIPNIDQIIAKRYNQKLADVQEWLSLTEWSQSLIDEDTIIEIQEQLYALGIISETVSYETLVRQIIKP